MKMEEQFRIYIDETVNALQEKERALAQSDRKDEADMVKIQINIYGICKTIYDVVCGTCAPEKVKEVYLQKLEDLPDNWKKSLEKAKAHEDIEKIVVEELKLEALFAVKKRFQELNS